MPIAIDIRPLQDARTTGVPNYAREMVDALTELYPDRFRFFSNGQVPSKLVNIGMRLFGSPTIDGVTASSAVWMPNLNYWSVGPRTKLVVTVHDLSFLIEPQWYGLRARLWHVAVNARGLLRRADAIIALSAHTKRELIERLGLPTEKIHVIPPGIPTVPVSEAEIQDTRYKIQTPFILYLGGIERRKNLVRAIQAFELAAERMPETRFIIAGMPGSGYAEIESTIRLSKFRDRIELIPSVTAEQKSSLLAHATAFFFPSLYEGFGFPPLEAMRAGVPVVASSAGALPETLGNAALLLDPMDVGGFAEALLSACVDTKCRQTLIARGLERVKDYSWERAAEATYSLLSTPYSL